MRIVKSPLSNKKYRAIFDNGKHTDFGASGYDDFTISHNEVKKKAYIARHKINEDWTDPYSSMMLSLCKTLYADYSTTTDSNYKASLSNVLSYKVSTLTTFVTLNNQNLLADISKIKPS